MTDTPDDGLFDLPDGTPKPSPQTRAERRRQLIAARIQTGWHPLGRNIAAGYTVVSPDRRATIAPLVLEYLATPAGRTTAQPVHIRTLAEEHANPSTCRHLVWHKGKDGNVYCGCGVALAALQRRDADGNPDLFGGAA